MGPTELVFERGRAEEPKGHALAYFRILAEREKLLATYLVILPIAVDFSKYVPPLLVPHLGETPLKEFSAFSLPPLPEEVESYEELRRLAEMRDDDIIYAGTLPSLDLPALIQAVNDIVQRYAQLWTEYAKTAASKEKETSLRVDEVLYSLMSERDRLGELARLVGKLRFAVEGGDEPMAKEAEEEIRILASHLPEHYRVGQLIAAARDPSPKGARLAQLYLERCYKLCDGDQEGVRALEERIESLEASG